MPLYLRALVANPASGIKAGDVMEITSPPKPMVNDPSYSLFNAEFGGQHALPSDGFEVFYRVFVYGSLMRGLHNHGVLNGARYLGPAETEREFLLTSYGSFPAAVLVGEACPDAVRLKGEVYEVPVWKLAQLDRLEGVGRGFYDRTVHQLRGWVHRLPVFVYTMTEVRQPVIPGGDWRSYHTSTRPEAW